MVLDGGAAYEKNEIKICIALQCMQLIRLHLVDKFLSQENDLQDQFNIMLTWLRKLFIHTLILYLADSNAAW
jgi:hypothetical protein